jgi:hypothetical protein
VSTACVNTMSGQRATIPSLLRSCGPTHVAGLVVPVIVDAIERVRGRRTWTHVREEGLEGLSPRATHANPAGAVVAICSMRPRVAPLLGALPRSILWRPSQSMLASAVALGVALCAAAAMAGAAPERRRGSRHDGAAVAATTPEEMRVAKTIAGELDGREPAKSRAGEIETVRLLTSAEIAERSATGFLVAEAAATLRSQDERLTPNGDELAASTAARPPGARPETFFTRRATEHGQAAEHASGQVDRRRHDANYTSDAPQPVFAVSE